jgi:hypothetical protein
MNKLVLALSLSTASAFVGPSVVSTPTVVEGGTQRRRIFSRNALDRNARPLCRRQG